VKILLWKGRVRVLGGQKVGDLSSWKRCGAKQHEQLFYPKVALTSPSYLSHPYPPKLYKNLVYVPH